MTTQSVRVVVEIPWPVARTFSHFAKHENQAEIFSVVVLRLRDGVPDPDGVGSARRLHSPPLPAFEEEITVFERDKRIEYKMKDSLKNAIYGHLGVLSFEPVRAGTRLDYAITFQPRIPFTGRWIQAMTERNLRRGLETLAHPKP